MFKTINLLLFTLMLTGCGIFPNTYLAAPISGTVIDKETKHPLEGVIVVAYYNLHKGGLAGRRQTGLLNVEETVTDKNGRYHFKAWGPVSTWTGRLGYESPQMLFAKAGYYHERKYNDRRRMFFGKKGAGEIHVPNAEETEDGVLYRSLWDGKKVELQKAKYDDEYARQLNFLSNDMDRIIRYGFDCNKKTIFRLIKYLHKEILVLKKNNIKRYVDDSLDIPKVKSCKSL